MKVKVFTNTAPPMGEGYDWRTVFRWKDPDGHRGLKLGPISFYAYDMTDGMYTKTVRGISILGWWQIEYPWLWDTEGWR